MVTGKLIFLVILILLIIFFIYMKFNAPRGPHYKLKSIAFNVDLNVFHETGKLGKHIHQSQKRNLSFHGIRIYGHRLICMRMALS